MIKVLKWLSIGIGSLIVLLVLIGSVLFFKGRSMAMHAPAVAVATLPVTTSDSALIERGHHITTAIAPCAGCHGDGLKGQHFQIPAALVDMAAPNLTRGKGGVGDDTQEQWLRALRGGVGRDGRQLIIMPAPAYAHMSDGDIAAVIAYLGTIPAIDNVLPARKIGPAGAMLLAAGALPLSANLIMKTKPAPSTVQPGETAEYGGYLVQIATCSECHGPDLEGTAGHGALPAPSLRLRARNWTEEAFRTTIHTGKTPEGKLLNPNEMPWPYFANMTDSELNAICMYIHSLPPSTTKGS